MDYEAPESVHDVSIFGIRYREQLPESAGPDYRMSIVCVQPAINTAIILRN